MPWSQLVMTNWIPFLSVGAAGCIVGLALAWVINTLQKRNAREMAEELFRAQELQRIAERNDLVEHMKASFGNLSLEALSRSTDEFLKLARATLETERVDASRDLQTQKGLIDQQLGRMNQEMENVCALIRELERDRTEKFGELASQLKATGEQTTALTHVTATLREALANTRARGQWGERMAEDILRIAGLVENINYCKQKTIEGSGTRPDFTFLLPHGLRLNMDVKFPLDNYIRFLAAEVESEKDRYCSMFLRDVRARIKEVTSRDYIDPAQNTVDCVLLFIPNEQIYAFVHEHDSSIFEQAISNRVVFCSPITLFAVIAVIRQAAENFALTQTSHEILSLLGRFKKRWDEFLKRLEVLGKRIGEAQQEYEAITTTRKRLLEKSLNDLEALRIEQGLPIAPDSEECVEEPLCPETVEQKQKSD